MTLMLYKFYNFVGKSHVKYRKYRQKTLAYDVSLC